MRKTKITKEDVLDASAMVILFISGPLAMALWWEPGWYWRILAILQLACCVFMAVNFVRMNRWRRALLKAQDQLLWMLSKPDDLQQPEKERQKNGT